MEAGTRNKPLICVPWNGFKAQVWELEAERLHATLDRAIKDEKQEHVALLISVVLLAKSHKNDISMHFESPPRGPFVPITSFHAIDINNGVLFFRNGSFQVCSSSLACLLKTVVN